MTDKELLEQALEALIPFSNAHFPDEREQLSNDDFRAAGRAVVALHEAIAQIVLPPTATPQGKI